MKNQITEISNAIDGIQDELEELVSFEGLVGLAKDILDGIYPADTLPPSLAEGGAENAEFLIALRHFLTHADPIVTLQHELNRARIEMASLQERSARLDMVHERARRLSTAVLQKAEPGVIEGYRAELMKVLEKPRG